MDAWLAEPSVIEALHVKANTPGMTYKKTATDLLPLYADLINKHQILIYRLKLPFTYTNIYK